MQLDLVPQLQELEVHRQRGRPPGARRRPRIPQHPAEVGIRVPAWQQVELLCVSGGLAVGELVQHPAIHVEHVRDQAIEEQRLEIQFQRASISNTWHSTET
jgi:hypothetical protein